MNRKESETELEDMEELFETVRLVRNLKEPSIPKGNYTENMVANINKQILKERNSRKPRRN